MLTVADLLLLLSAHDPQRRVVLDTGGGVLRGVQGVRPADPPGPERPGISQLLVLLVERD